MDIILKLKEELKVEKWQVEAAVKLIDEGNTIPFISRYRKEATGSLNDEALRNLYERLVYLRNLEEKKEQVLGSIEEQGMLTEELREKILAAETQVLVEDLYRPYRPKRKTRASVAKEKGLEPLALYIKTAEREGAGGERGGEIYRRRKGRLRRRRRRCRGQRIFWRKAFPTRRRIGFISAMPLWRRALLLQRQRMKKRRASMKCITSLKSR